MHLKMMIYFHYQINGGMIMNIQKAGKYIVKLRKGKGWTQLNAVGISNYLSDMPTAFNCVTPHTGIYCVNSMEMSCLFISPQSKILTKIL